RAEIAEAADESGRGNSGPLRLSHDVRRWPMFDALPETRGNGKLIRSRSLSTALLAHGAMIAVVVSAAFLARVDAGETPPKLYAAGRANDNEQGGRGRGEVGATPALEAGNGPRAAPPGADPAAPGGEPAGPRARARPGAGRARPVPERDG